MAEFEVGGELYRTNRMTARQQFHVARKLMPVISRIRLPETPPSPGGDSVTPDAAAPTIPTMEALLSSLGPLSEALASMPTADCDYVLDTCLSVCQRRSGAGTWANVWDQRSGSVMFMDIDLPAMLRIAMQVITENLQSFSASGGQT